MTRRRIGAMVAIVVVAALAPQVTAAQLQGGLAALDPWVGTWQIEATWAGGRTLWAQTEYRPLLGGRFLEGRTWVRDGGGELYQRYRTVLRWDDGAQHVAAHTFHHDGRVSESALEVDGRTVTTTWWADAMRIEERLVLDAEAGTMAWLVWTTAESGERRQVMDGTWRRVAAAQIALPPAEPVGPVAALAPWLGGWEIADAWADGTPLWARSEYRSAPGGRFVDAATWTLDAEGVPYQRYATVFAADADGDPPGLAAITFAADGEVTAAVVRAAADGSVAAYDITPAAPSQGHDRVRQRIALTDGETFSWQVWVRPDPSAAWSLVMDGRWRRQGAAAAGAPGPIHPDRFAAGDGGHGPVILEREIAAPAARVWAAWTTAEGWSRVYPPPAHARIELTVGGAYEWTFNGWLGSNGCQVLSFVPERMLSFSWNAPPSQAANRLQRTWVVVESEALAPARTRVRLTHLGFGDGAAWDETRRYFAAAWARVLDRMAEALER